MNSAKPKRHRERLSVPHGLYDEAIHWVSSENVSPRIPLAHQGFDLRNEARSVRKDKALVPEHAEKVHVDNVEECRMRALTAIYAYKA